MQPSGGSRCAPALSAAPWTPSFLPLAHLSPSSGLCPGEVAAAAGAEPGGRAEEATQGSPSIHSSFSGLLRLPPCSRVPHPCVPRRYPHLWRVQVVLGRRLPRFSLGVAPPVSLPQHPRDAFSAQLNCTGALALWQDPQCRHLNGVFKKSLLANYLP